jgi:hypothetical protein
LKVCFSTCQPGLLIEIFRLIASCSNLFAKCLTNLLGNNEAVSYLRVNGFISLVFQQESSDQITITLIGLGAILNEIRLTLCEGKNGGFNSVIEQLLKDKKNRCLGEPMEATHH